MVTMSVMSVISWCTMEWTPHTRQSRLAVVVEGVTPKMGTKGLSRAALRVVAPEEVKVTMALV